MKPLKIALWIGISFGLGKGLNILFSPSEVIYSFVLSVFPFILMGFQENLTAIRRSLSVFDKRIRVRTETVRVKTFWGIPIGQPETSDTVDEWFPDTTPKEILEYISYTTEVVISTLVKRALKGLVSQKSLPYKSR